MYCLDQSQVFLHHEQCVSHEVSYETVLKAKEHSNSSGYMLKLFLFYAASLVIAVVHLKPIFKARKSGRRSYIFFRQVRKETTTL